MSDSKHTIRIRCAGCDEVIGVYEPIVVLGESGPRVTSVAAEERGFASRPGKRYHAACWPASDTPA